MSKKLTIETIREKCVVLYGDEYYILDQDYIGNKLKILIKHTCGTISKVNVSGLLSKKSGCQNCLKIPKYDIDGIKKRCFDIFGDEYTILSDVYKNTKTKIIVKHNVCNNEYGVQRDSFLIRGQRCPECFGNLKLSILDIKDRCLEIHGDEYSILSNDIKNTSSKIEVIHNRCNNSYFINVNSFINGKIKCAFCNGTKKQSIDILKDRCYKLHGDKYEILSELYINIDKKILVKHNECGYEWNVKATNFINKKSGCPMCSPKSKGELLIIEYLTKNNIKFYKEKEFENCKYESYLHFDFYLLDLNICIEFDGQQHFKPIEYFGGEESYRKQIEKDSIKNDYCINNNIKLIRIPYWELGNIDSILNTELL